MQTDPDDTVYFTYDFGPRFFKQFDEQFSSMSIVTAKSAYKYDTQDFRWMESKLGLLCNQVVDFHTSSLILVQVKSKLLIVSL